MVISNEDLCRIVAIVTSRLRKFGSGTSVLFGEGAPSNTPRPSNSNSIYIDSLTGNIYDWNPSTNSWDLMVSGASTEFGTSTEDPTDPPASGDPSVVLNTDNGQIWFWDGSDWVSYGDALEGKYVTISGDPQTITSEKTFNSVFNIGNNILPTNNNVYNIGASGNVFNTIWAENLAYNGALRLSASQGYYFSQNAAFNWNQVIGGFFNPGNEFFIQAPGPVPANSGHRLQVYGNSLFVGSVNTQNILPRINNTYDIGGPSGYEYRAIWGRLLRSNNSLTLGAANAFPIIILSSDANLINNVVAGFHSTTRNFFLQASGTANADLGHRFQLFGNQYVQGYTDVSVTTATPSGTYAAPISPVVKLTLTSNPTLNFANHTTGLSTTIKLILIQDATGGRTITWGNVKFPGAIPPTLSSTANARDVLTLLWDGEMWYLDNFIPDVR